MYLEFIGTPTEKDLQKFPSVHLTRPHDSDPFVIDYVHQIEMGSLHSLVIQMIGLNLIPTLMNLEIMLIELYNF